MTSLVSASASASAPITSDKTPASPARKQARIYLNNLLNKILLVHTTDNRMFRGEFKCTDSDLNIILSETYEYRIPPSPPTSTTPSPQQPPSTTSTTSTSPADPPSPSPTPLLNIIPRWLGLVVVPGEYILRIELEKFESQAGGGQTTTSTSTSASTFDPLATTSADSLVKGKEVSI